MPYEPTRGVYRYIDEGLGVLHQTSGHRAKQVLPRKDYNPAEIARKARHQAREEVRQKNRQPDEDELYEDEDVYTQRPPRSAVRWPPGGTNGVNVNYTSPPPTPKQRHAIPPRRSAIYQSPPALKQPDIEEEEVEEEKTTRVMRRPKVHFHPLVWLGIGMIVMIFLWAGYSNALNWWQIHQDDTTYGRPRTFQIDEVVGHNDSASNPSHFEAINLNRHVIVIELPGGDPTKARIYPVTTLFGDGQELTPVTISFKDVDVDGVIDMEIHIENQTLVMINDKGAFRPLKAGEHVHL